MKAADVQINKVSQDWKRIKLGDAIEVIRGASPRPKGDPRYFGGKIPWIMIADVTREKGKYLSDTRQHVTEEGAKKSRYLKAGTLILSNSATVCVPKILKVDGCIHDGFVAFPNLPQDIDIYYLYYFFEYIRPQIINENRQGITQVNLNTGIVKDIDLILAPPDDQKNIVAEIEKQFSRLDEAVAGLKRIKANLKRYKAAVLKAAIEGKLTEEWRKAHPNVETGSELLKRILVERKKKWEEKNPGKKYKEPVAPDTSNLPGLPKGWVWATTDQLFSFVTSGSRGWASYYADSGPLFLRMGNLDHDTIKLDLADIQRVQPPVGTEGTRTRVMAGDILISITADVGMIGLVPEVFEEAYINQHIALGRPATLNSLYLAWFLACKNGQDQLRGLQRGATKVGLGLEDIRAVNVPLPPLTEQKAIIEEVDRCFSVVNGIDLAVETNLKRAERLRQSILKKAFSGRLMME